MTDSNNSGTEWIQAWIEQQREQLRRAGMPGTQAPGQTDAGTQSASSEPASSAARDLRSQWLATGQSYLQGWQQFAQHAAGGAAANEPPKFDEMFNAWQGAWMGVASASEGAGRQFADLIARMPAFGLAREHTESWRELVAAQAEYQQLEQELRSVWAKVQTDALAMVERMIQERKETHEQAEGISNYRELYDLWIECGEKAFSQVAHSEAYSRLQAQACNALIRLRARQQAVIERGLKYFDLPTRSELNTVHRQMRELRERVAELETKLAHTRGQS